MRRRFPAWTRQPLRLHLRETPDPLSDHIAAAPEALDALVATLLAKRADSRAALRCFGALREAPRSDLKQFSCQLVPSDPINRKF